MSVKLAMTEDQFQNRTIQLARACGWRVAHFRAGMNRRGQWATPVSADGAGFPDCVMVKGKTILFVEFKSSTGKVSPEQTTWLTALSEASYHSKSRVYVRTWRPEDSDDIEQVLTEK